MKTSRSLKQRIARSFLLLALLLAGFFTAVSYIAVEVIEEQVIDARLDKLAEELIRYHGRREMLKAPPDISFFTNETIPQELRQTAPGVHELMLEGRPAQVLIRVAGPDRFAVVHDMTEFEQTELVIFTVLGAGFVSSLILAIFLGLGTAKHVITRVSALAEAVEKDAGPATLPSQDANDEIGVLARAFAKRTDDLQRFLMRERLFTGDVSHELRTPLTVMLGAAEVLKTQLAGRPAQLAVAERMRRVAAETSERVSALLLLSRSPELLDAPRTALNPLIQSEFDRCRFLLAGKPVQCRIEWSEQVWADVRPELAGIVIGNLLRNACQHTDTGAIVVTLTANQLIIEDNGPGIPQTVRSRLFERFVQGDAASAEGTGLGLSIVKRVVEHIKWDVRLDCPETGGSRFTLSFPPPKPVEVLS